VTKGDGGVSLPLVALFGPTGIGKTEIALSLAELIDAEIVSADSMQVYRGLPIVTNQPTPEQLARVPHHLVGFVDPREEFSAAAYARFAGDAVAEVRDRGRAVILEGGSGLYMRAGLGGLTFGAAPSPALRRELEELAQDDPDTLLRRLGERDPAARARIDVANLRRVVRTLETVIAQDRPLSPEQVDRLWSPEHGIAHYPVCLDVERDAVRDLVERRVDRMVAAGLVDEVARAAAAGPLSRTVRQAIGVAESLGVLDGTLPLDDAVRAIKARTRRYVRRQTTWMRKLPDAVIIPTSGRCPDDVARDIGARLF
jgi:tRNA dimethylallyltransferase